MTQQQDIRHDHSADVVLVQSLAQVPLILDLCSQISGMGFVAIARVTEDRWVTCASKDDLGFGLGPGDELAIKTTICNEVRASRQLVLIDDVAASAQYVDHRTPAMYGFRSYISVPIIQRNGAFFGTLCAIDPEPRKVSESKVVNLFRLFADLIATGLDAAADLDDSRSDLADVRATAKLREEFIAVVGHDLRNPVAALSAGLRMLSKPNVVAGDMIVREMQASVLRMASLVDNLMDFARGRLGGSIEVGAVPVDLDTVIESVAEEFRMASGRDIRVDVDLAGPVRADPAKVGQMLSNLIANAITHGDREAAVLVRARRKPTGVIIEVENRGPTIPQDVLGRLFEPYARGRRADGAQGLGLGLYIASEIARAHHGSIEVKSNERTTIFSIELPA